MSRDFLPSGTLTVKNIMNDETIHFREYETVDIITPEPMKGVRTEEMEPKKPTDHCGVALTGDVCAEEERAVVPESSVVGTECYPGNTAVASFTEPSNDPNSPLMVMLTPKKAATERAFCDWVVDCIESNGNGRFLEWNARVGGWVVITDKTKIV